MHFPLSYIIIIALALVLLLLIIVFNRFVRNRNFVKDAWSNIDVALKKRYDLIPNLVEIVKGYAKHETETLDKVMQARSQAMQVPQKNIPQKIAAENLFSHAVRSIFLIVESYPILKANESFMELQNKLAEVEETLERSRRYYNGTVRENNMYGERFPGILLAKILNYQHYDFYTIDDSSRESVEVTFQDKQ